MRRYAIQHAHILKTFDIRKMFKLCLYELSLGYMKKRTQPRHSIKLDNLSLDQVQKVKSHYNGFTIYSRVAKANQAIWK